MRRLLFPLVSTFIVACSISPMVGSDNKPEESNLEYGALGKDELKTLPLPKPRQAERQRPKKIARYSRPCSAINTGDLKADILAKLDCIDAELQP